MINEEKILHTFIWESNLIEGVKTEDAFNDSLSAWRYILKQVGDFEGIHIPAMLRVHSEVMRRLDPMIAGEFRQVNVTVGGHKTVDFSSVPDRMQKWVELYSTIPTFGRSSTKEGLEVIAEHIRKAHIAFESIHPFEDGNGRVGRLLLNWQRVALDLPILIIYDKEKEDYYNWFRDSTTPKIRKDTGD